MKDINVNPDEDSIYECFDCGTVVTAPASGTCPDCGTDMRNRQMPIE